MQYICAFAEKMPFPSGYFDFVYSINSLDHVDNLEMVISEIMRVVAPGGHFLLLTDLHEEPTSCEPVTFSWDIVKKFSKLTLLRELHFEKDPSMTKSITVSPAFDHSNPEVRNGILSAMFRCL